MDKARSTMNKANIIKDLKMGFTISSSEWGLLLEQSIPEQDYITLSAEASRVQATLVIFYFDKKYYSAVASEAFVSPHLIFEDQKATPLSLEFLSFLYWVSSDLPLLEFLRKNQKKEAKDNA